MNAVRTLDSSKYRIQHFARLTVSQPCILQKPTRSIFPIGHVSLADSYIFILLNLNILSNLLVRLLFSRKNSCYPNPDLDRYKCEDSSFNCGDFNLTLKPPFRFEGDPRICRFPHFNISCHDDKPVLNHFRQSSGEENRYYIDVHSIDYERKTIDHVRDIGLQKGNCSTLPLHRFREYLYEFFNMDTISIKLSLMVNMDDTEELVFVRCENPVKYQPESKLVRLVNTESCNYTVSYDYVGLASNLVSSDIEESCTVNLIAPAQMDGDWFYSTKQDSVTFQSMHNLLTNGFRFRVVGTYDYIPPEYVRGGIYSTKSGVFSFGVLLLQIISGKKITSFYGQHSNLTLLEYAYELWTNDKGREFLEETLDDAASPCKLMTCFQIALQCVQEDPNERPSMLDVSYMLRNETTALRHPKRPAFSIKVEGAKSTTSSSAGIMDTGTITEVVRR